METQVNVIKRDGVKWTLTVEAGSDKATGVLVYTDRFDGWMARCPLLRSAHPDIASMLLIKIDAGREDGRMIEVTLTYESWSGQFGQKESKIYDLEITTSEEHILSHPRYESLSEVEQEALMNISNGTEADDKSQRYESRVTSSNGLECLAKIRAGTTHYLEPGMVWTQRYTSDSLGAVNASDVGNIANPPNAPSAGSRNWLYLGARASGNPDGRTWTIEKQWRLSGRKRWDTDLYND